MHRQYSRIIRESKSGSLEHVSTLYGSLDYDRYSNKVIVLEEEARGKTYLATTVLQRIFLFMLVGALSGFFGALTELGVHYGTGLRYSMLKQSVNEYFENNLVHVYFIWIISIFIPGIIGSVLVFYGEEKAIGGGGQWCLGYLNGIDLGTHMTFRILVIKILSCMLCVVSGLPGGKEAPLIHIGAIVGSLVPSAHCGKFYPFDYFCQDAERRDLAAAGTGAGLTSAFATPLAGIMLTFEEDLSFWDPELTFLIFVCTITSFFTLRFIMSSVIDNCAECVTNDVFLLEVVKTTSNYFMLSEIFICILIGILGGLSGAAWNYLQMKLIVFRIRYLTNPIRRLIEMCSIIVIVGICQVSMLKIFENHCVKKEPSVIFLDHHFDNHVQLGCGEGHIPSISLMLLQGQVTALRSLFTQDSSMLGAGPLFAFCLFYFLGSCLLCGSSISQGVFIPNILTGALGGRLLAELLQPAFPPQARKWLDPNKLAFLCGAAQLSGCLHITYTISVLLLEVSGGTALAIPLFVVVCTAKFVAGLFNQSLYASQAVLSGLPMLGKTAPPRSGELRVDQVMASPVSCLPRLTTFREIYALLRGTKHSGFPVVDSLINQNVSGHVSYGRLRGLIPRSYLVCLSNGELTTEMLQRGDKAGLRRARQALAASTSLNQEDLEDEDTIVNLEPFMNDSPFVINVNASLSSAYRLFANLGIQYLIVVTDDFEVAGVLSRKDLAVFRYRSRFCRAETRVLPLR